jgi:hypothetical protein
VHHKSEEFRRMDPFLFIAGGSVPAFTPERIGYFINFLPETAVICRSNDATYIFSPILHHVSVMTLSKIFICEPKALQIYRTGSVSCLLLTIKWKYI